MAIFDAMCVYLNVQFAANLFRLLLDGKKEGNKKSELQMNLTAWAAVAAILSLIYVMVFGGRGIPETLNNGIRKLFSGVRRRKQLEIEKRKEITYSPSVVQDLLTPEVWTNEVKLVVNEITQNVTTIVVGPPGAGKSTVVKLARVALQSANVIEGALRYRCPDGAFSTQAFLDAMASRVSVSREADEDPTAFYTRISSKISQRNILVKIDNLEHWTEDVDWVLTRVDDFGDKPRIVLTANCAVPWKFTDRSVRLNGMQETATKIFLENEALRIGGGQLADVFAPEGVVEEVHSLTAGNPLAAKWIVLRVGEGEDLDYLLSRLRSGDLERFYFEVFGRFWNDMPPAAQRVVEIVSSFPHPVTKEIVLELTNGTKFDDAASVDFGKLNLLEEISTPSGPHFDVHPITRKHINSRLLGDKRYRRFFVSRAIVAMKIYCENARGLDIKIDNLQEVYDQVLNVIFVARLAKTEASTEQFVDYVEKIEDFLLIFGFFNERIEFNINCAEIASDRGDAELEAHFRITSAGAMTAVGRQEEARSQAELAFEIGSKQGSDFLKGRAKRIASTIEYRSHNIELAKDELSVAQDFSATAKDEENLLEIDFLVACIELWQGNYQAATQSIDRGSRRAESVKWERGTLYMKALKAHAELLAGEIAEATTFVSEGLPKAKRTQDKRLFLMFEYASALIKIKTGKRKLGLDLLKSLQGDYELLGMPNEHNEVQAALSKYDRMDLSRIGLQSPKVPNHFGDMPIYGL